MSSSLLDIARACRVSKATVSLALRNDPRIAAPTKARVVAAAEQLGYAQNPMISALMSHLRNRSPLPDALPIAWINAARTKDHWHAEPYNRSFFEGARRRAQQLGYRLEEFWLRSPGMTPARQQQILSARGIRGVILPSGELFTAADRRGWDRFAVVALDRPLGPAPFDFVGAHWYYNAGLALEAGVALGYTRIGLALPERLDAITVHAYRARFLIHTACAAPRHRVPPLLYGAGRADEPAILRWFQRHRPDLIICRDRIVRRVLAAAGVDVPSDVGLAHMNLNANVAGWSGIDEGHDQLGARAAESLISALQRNEAGGSSNPRETLVRGNWVAGSTTRPL
jgi:LacI family transcriptional regulator